MTTLSNEHLKTILTLEREIWHKDINITTIRQWLEQFTGRISSVEVERDIAVELLAHFMLFGQRELEVLCKSLFVEHLWCDLAHQYRRRHEDTTDVEQVANAVRNQLAKTLVVGPGGAAGSGSHLLYYFRNTNGLPAEIFATSSDLLSRSQDRLEGLERIVLLDDLCATGKTADKYYNELVKPFLTTHSNRDDVGILYLTLFATARGLERARGHFDSHTAMYLDDTYRCFDDVSRYFDSDGRIGEHRTPCVEAARILSKYGRQLYLQHPLGYENSQLLLGFSHNIPNNTLPIFWSNGSSSQRWFPLFRRHTRDDSAL